MTREYLNFKEVVEQYPISPGTLRKYLLFRHVNGLSGATLKQGRKLIFHRGRFEAWLEKFAEVNEEIGAAHAVSQQRRDINE